MPLRAKAAIRSSACGRLVYLFFYLLRSAEGPVIYERSFYLINILEDGRP